MRRLLLALGAVLSIEEFEALIRTELADNAELIKTAGIKPN
jgi:hypothetical protein